MSAPILRVLQNSTALAASRPLVELSQHWSGAPERAASMMETRLRSPPETPRTNSLPTKGRMQCG